MTLEVSLAHAFDGFELDCAFSAPAGVTALFGRSGSGKTTVVQAVAGLLKPGRGRVRLEDRILVDTAARTFLPPHRRRIGYVFQEGRLFPHLSVRQNLEYGQRFSARRSNSGDFAHIVALLGIEDLLARRPGSLSGGEKQRVAIGRALLSSPQLLAMDEPLAALDEPRKREILPYLERVRDEAGIPILYVSHSLTEVARLATTLVVLEGGKVVAAGPSADVLSDPAMAARFGGREAGAVLRGKVIRHHEDGLSEIAIDGSTLFLPAVDAAPERLRQAPFLHALRQGGLTRLVIDEAHCISIWGHDFRPDYLHVAQAHRDLGAPPVLALTATAPPLVRQDIERQLFHNLTSANGQPRTMRLIATDTFRPNLNLSAIHVRNEDEKLSQLVGLCSSLAKEGHGIVYARTRQRCEDLANLLQHQGIRAEYYHAGLANRAEVQDRFMAGDIELIVATIAFGMGVDKPDIRFIVHYGLPNSVEAYYQEAGRAGRDGQRAYCVLLHSNHDRTLLTRFAGESAVSADFLRKVYRLVRDLLQAQNPGAVPLENLLRALKADDTQVRVALSMLEEVGLLVRHYDAPRTVRMTLLNTKANRTLASFAKAVNLRPNQPITRPYMELAAAAHIHAAELELKLLDWQAAGLLTFDTRGRDLLLTLAPPAADVSRRVERLLDRHAAIQHQRVTELVDYARTRRCRHGHLANYLGGAPRANCGACDSCAEGAQATFNAAVPPEASQMQLILQALDEQSWGRRSLTRLLRGDPEVNERGQSSRAYATLGFRSEASLEELIDALVQRGHVQEKTLTHGGVTLKITAAGRRTLTNI